MVGFWTRGRCWLLFQHQARDRTGGTGTGGSQMHSKAPASPPARSCYVLPCKPPSHWGPQQLKALPLRASWAKYLTSTSWSWVSFSRMGFTSLCSVLEGQGRAWGWVSQAGRGHRGGRGPGKRCPQTQANMGIKKSPGPRTGTGWSGSLGKWSGGSQDPPGFQFAGQRSIH